MREYATARGLYSFLEFLAWILVIIGAVAAILSAQGARGGFGGSGAMFLAAAPGMLVAIYGLVQAALIQAARAVTDTAEMTGKMLTLQEEQLRIQKAMARATLAPSGSAAPGFAPTASARTETIAATAPAVGDRPPANPPTPDQLTAAWRGKTEAPKVLHDISYGMVSIEHREDGYHFGERVFPDLPSAKAYVDQCLKGSGRFSG